MSDVQVTCATKTNRRIHETITTLGGPGWLLLKQEVARRIDSGVARYFTQLGPSRASQRMYFGQNVTKYVKIQSDPIPQNDVINLPGC
jgi:hypothetical protein